MLQPALQPTVSAFGALRPVAFSGRQCGRSEFVTQRDIARDEAAARMAAQNIPAILAEQYDATLWHILHNKPRSGRSTYYLTLDRRNNDTLQRIAESPEKLDLLTDWLGEKKPDLLESFETAREKSEETGSNEAVHRWIRLNRKGIEWFITDRQKEYTAELSRWVDEHREPLAELFSKALGVEKDDISLLPRLRDSCCFVGCTSCLNSRPELRKSWVV